METFSFQPFQVHFIFDYIRMVCYSMIILTSLRNVVNRKATNILFIGDIIVCFALFISALNIITIGVKQDVIADKVITPAVVLWAGIHFYEFLREDGENLTLKHYKHNIKKEDKK